MKVQATTQESGPTNENEVSISTEAKSKEVILNIEIGQPQNIMRYNMQLFLSKILQILKIVHLQWYYHDFSVDYSSWMHKGIQ